MDVMKYFVKEEVYMIGYVELEAIIVEQFGVEDFDFAADQELLDDDIKMFYVYEKDDEFTSYDITKFTNFLNGVDTMYVTNLLLRILCNQNRINQGNYLVQGW